MNVAIATGNPIKVQAAERAFADAFPDSDIEIQHVAADLKLREQPMGDAIVDGAIRRANAAQQCADADFGVGIEAGLMQLPGTERWMSIQVCAIVDQDGRSSVGMGPGYELPKPILDAVLSGEPLREAFERLLGQEDPERRGAVFFLSNGRSDRMDLTIQAVRMALILWLNDSRRGSGPIS